jgi:hypothetical protein
MILRVQRYYKIVQPLLSFYNSAGKKKKSFAKQFFPTVFTVRVCRISRVFRTLGIVWVHMIMCRINTGGR